MAFALVATAVAVLTPVGDMGKVYADYDLLVAAGGTITFGPGETEKTISNYYDGYAVFHIDNDLFSAVDVNDTNTSYTRIECPLDVPDGTYYVTITYNDTIVSGPASLFSLRIKVQRGANNPDPANPANDTKGGNVTKESTPPHTCHFEWVTETEATETSDGVEVLQCPVCGKIAGRNYTSGSGILIGNVMSKIANAPAGGTVTIDTTYLTCFPKSVFDALLTRPDVTLVVNYTYEHVNYTMTIPAGASQIPGVVDENGYAGFRRIAAYFLTTTR